MSRSLNVTLLILLQVIYFFQYLHFHRQEELSLISIIIWISIGTSFFGWVGGKMDDRDSKKERCINETYNIKNEFTAKKKYKACMKR